MLYDCIIARSTDGLLLCEVQFETSPISFELKRQAKQFLRKGKARVESEYQNIEPDPSNKQIKAILKSHSGVGYMIFFDQKYNFKLACLFLDDLKDAFEEEMKNKFGTSGVDIRSRLETIESNDSYCFQSFERFIKRKRQEYLDVNSTKNTERLKQEINELSKIMSENIQLLVDRENNLSSMSTKARNLRDDSKIVQDYLEYIFFQQFKDQSQKLYWSLWMRQNTVIIIVVLFILIFIYFKFF